MSVDETDPSDPSRLETDWVRRAREGDDEAFGQLVKLHYEPVFRLAYSIVRNEHDARDVCQDVWVKAWGKLATYRGEAKFSTWLHPIVVRRSVDHLRKQRRWFDRFIPFKADVDDETQPSAPEPEAPDTDPRDRIEADDRRERFERALASLPAKHRVVLALREVEGLSYEEISKTVKCRPGTVMSRLFHARRMLARKLGDTPCE